MRDLNGDYVASHSPLMLGIRNFAPPNACAMVRAIALTPHKMF